MNLKCYLLVRITLVAIICLLVSGAYALYRVDLQSKQQSQLILDSITKELEMQLLRIDTGYGRPNQFPDLSVWKKTRYVPGICIRFTSKNNQLVKGICRGTEWPDNQWPLAFKTLYLSIFSPVTELSKQITYKNQIHGLIRVIPSIERELNQAWGNLRTLLELTIMNIFAICCLVYIIINRALYPANRIVSGLEKMQNGDLTERLPQFQLLEWQKISTSINELAISQQTLLDDRKTLTFKLISLRDEERRYLARELHDELGQCLAAINALAASITQTAKQKCHIIVDDIESITRINRHIMNTIRTLLVKLRPTEIDELGLELGLNSLMNKWNSQTNNKTHYKLILTGHYQHLPEPYPITLFRIIQESMTNIAKHSCATNAVVELTINDNFIILTINDNGIMDSLPSADNSGVGLLGVRERVSALGGQLQLIKNESGGLCIKVSLPIQYKK